MKKLLLGVIALGMLVACKNESDAKFVDVNGDGTADIKYVDNKVVDLDEGDAITVDGNVVTNTETNKNWDIVNEEALENSFENIGADLKEFGNDVKEGAKKVGNDIEEGAKKAGNDIEQGAKNTANDIEEGAKKVGDDIEAGTKKAGDEIKEGANKVGNSIEKGIDKLGKEVEKAGEKMQDDNH